MNRAANSILKRLVQDNPPIMNGNAVHTQTNLKRWSCQDKQLPPIEKVKHIHVYDFDNTLFASPLPNKQIWNGSTCGSLQAEEFLHNGGWWHNPRILAATGGGLEVEEPRAWQGCWNEKIVELVELSMRDEETLTVLLTGRSEHGFAELVGRMVAAKRLDFDIMALKPRVGPTGEVFKSTINFKESILRDLVYTYAGASELRIYEDRPKHVKAFQQFFEGLNHGLMSNSNAPRAPITAEVVFVSEQELNMDPVSEVAEVQSMINEHNQAILNGTAPPRCIPYKIKRSVFYTGYIISGEGTDRLKTLVRLPPDCPEHELRYFANNILITPRPPPKSILDKVGGIGAKVTWKVTGVAVHEQRVWAARVQPVPANTRIYTENHTPFVVLATRRQSKPIEAGQIRNWQPVPEDQAFQFGTVVGEKVSLRIEEELRNEDDYESAFAHSRNARKHPREEEFPPLGPRNSGPSRPQQRNTSQGAWGNRGGGGGGGASGFSPGRGGNLSRGGASQRGGGPSGGFRGRRGRGGRGGGRGAYRSLDDSAGQGYGGAGMQY